MQQYVRLNVSPTYLLCKCVWRTASAHSQPHCLQLSYKLMPLLYADCCSSELLWLAGNPVRIEVTWYRFSIYLISIITVPLLPIL
jgi:hypothetical protein